MIHHLFIKDDMLRPIKLSRTELSECEDKSEVGRLEISTILYNTAK